MQDSNYPTYDTSGYDVPDTPYVPYTSSPFVPQYEDRAEPAFEMPSDVSDQSGDSEDVFTAYAPLPGQFAEEPAEPPRKKRTLRWPVVAGVVVALLLVLSGVAFGVYSLVSYNNRSTPMRTLDTFCTDLQKEDYSGAYSQFSANLQQQMSETLFASYISPDKVVTCTHGIATEAGTSTKTSLRLIHDSKGVNDDLVILKKDTTSIWKIDDLQVSSTGT
jgi:hypothetical protein